ncbi:MAG: hypothetical protein A2031_06710 [Deltaproteobacteria bacterium RBG_19FT_COMBO_43_11]|nr:MAG: hypothetical protein A2031_06710 [Deltaproteobacteria bacterium RBG_19FT_COMBO_43_11]
MKKVSVILILVASFFLAVFLNADAQVAKESFSIHYNHAGLRTIEVKEGQLHYVWHSSRIFGEGEPQVMRQDMKTYDRYEAHIWLTQQDLVVFQNWIAEYNVFKINTAYPSASGNKSFAAAFTTSLSVAQEGKAHSVSWAGDSVIPVGLKKAVEKLTRICEETLKTRRKENQ